MSAAQWDDLLVESEELARAWQSVLDEFSRTVLEDLTPAAADALKRRYLDAMTGPVSPDATMAARDLANTAAESLLRDLAETQLRAIGDTIARALEEGKRPADIARQLTDVSMLDAPRQARLAKAEELIRSQGLSPEAEAKAIEREKDKLLRERQVTIARTEGSKAVSAARNIEAQDRGARFKGWTADAQCCDVCAANEAAGIIGIDEDFPSGDSMSPAHPRCECSVFYVTSDAARAVAEERQAERIAATAARRGGSSDEE